MKKQEHNNSNSTDKDFIKSLPKVELPYTRSKEDVWQQLSSQMEDQPTITPINTGKTIKLRNWLSAAAAVVVLLTASTAFMRFYTRKIEAGFGTHKTALLPDGSSIELNAGSVIEYQPFWWNFKREVKFEGEGFFKVQKGQSFEVVSSLGRTIVLGTSFNIYARKNEYKVTCYTGKVRVVSIVSGDSKDITPNQQAIVQPNGTVVRHKQTDVDNTISWINHMFIFTGTPIQTVFEEIERQYGINIKGDQQLNYLYSGHFTRKQPAERVIGIICKSLGLKYKRNNGTYLISQ